MLHGLRIIERTDRLSVRFAGQLLAALGAEVITEASSTVPQADDLGRCLDTFMSRLKRTRPTIPGAAITVAIERYDPHRGSSVRESPTVFVAPLSFAAETKQWEADALTLAHFIGLGSVTPSGATLDDPPLRLPRRLLERSAGVTIATAVLGLHELAQRGENRFAHVSELQALMPFIATLLPPYLLGEGIPSRTMPTLADLLTPCKDGEVTFSFVQETEWQRFANLIGQPDWGEIFAGYQTRRENWEAIVSLARPWLSVRTKREIFDLCQEARVPCGMVQQAADVLSNEQLATRKFFQQMSDASGRELTVPGLPWQFHMSEEPPSGESVRPLPARPSPALRRRKASTRLPLEGVRVLEVGGFWAAPRCAAVLAELGAEVIKVETIKRPDMRDIVRHESGEVAVVPKPFFESVNTNKLSCTLNLEQEDGKALFLDLVRQSDIVVENFRPKTLERFGLGFHDLARANGRIVLISLSGFGQEGPYQLHSAYGPILESMSGVRSLLGYLNDSRTHLAGASYSDPVSGAFGAFAGLAAYLRARDTGIGSHVDYSQVEGLLALVPELIIEYQLTGTNPAPGGNRENESPPIGVYRCSGHDQWIAIGGVADQAWVRLVDALQLDPSLATLGAAERCDRQAELDAAITSITQGRDAYELALFLQQSHGITASPAHSIRDIVEETARVDPGLLVSLAGEAVRLPKSYGSVIRFDGEVPLQFDAAPAFGQHNDYVFSALLGLSRDERAALTKAGAIC